MSCTMTRGQLLGSVRFGADGVWKEPRPSKPLLLLCYLAYTGEWVTRERLAFLFWPDSPDRTAKVNLRQLLRRARTTAFAGELEIESERVRWPIATDVAEFRQAVAEGRWSDACKLYRGALLDGLYGTGAIGAWLDLEREVLARSWQRAALAWSTDLERAGRHHQAADLLAELLAGDELAEDVLQRYLGAAYLAGRRDDALRRYDAFRKRLSLELDLEPLDTTQALAASIRASAPLTAEPARATRGPDIPLTLRRPPRLIGREDDVAKVRSSDTAMVLVGGDAGSGKTRLLTELAPDAVVLRAQEGMQSVPYYPVTVAIRQQLESGGPLPDLGFYRGDLARLVPEIAPEIQPEAIDPELTQVRLLEALARYFEAQGANGNTLLVDDLQWCDEATLYVVMHLLPRGTVRVLAAYRPREAGQALRAALAGLRRAGLLHEHQLPPLTEADIERLMADLTDSDRGPVVFSRWLWRTAGGNPMFTLETLKALFEAGVLRADERGWSSTIDEITRDYSELRVPEAVTQVIERRVARLSGKARRVLEGAAVAGAEFDAGLLAHVSGLTPEAVLGALSEAEEAGLVRNDAFAHDLVRQSIHAGLGGGRRRALHTLVARNLGPDTEPSIRAEHWLAAQQLAPAVEAWLEAVEGMWGKGLFDAAALLLERGAERCDDPLLRQRLEVRLIEVLQQAGRNGECMARSEALLADCEVPELRAAIHNARALVQLREGRIEAAMESVDQLDRELEHAGANREGADITMTRAILHHARGEHDATIALLEPLVARLRLAPAGTTFGMVLTSLAAAYDMMGEHLRALPLHREALAHAKVRGHRFFQVDAALNYLYCLIDLGRAEEGLAEAEAALALGRFDNTPSLRANLAAAYVELGRDRDALRHYRQVIEESEHDFLLAIAWARLAEIHHRLGNAPESTSAIDRAIAAATATDHPLARARVLIATLQRGTEAQRRAVNGWRQQIDPAGLPEYVREELTALD